MTSRLMQHPLHLIAILTCIIGVAIGFWTGQSEQLIGAALMIAFITAVDLARRLGLEPADDPAAPHNRGKV